MPGKDAVETGLMNANVVVIADHGNADYMLNDDSL
jgi:bisphosphoglycerate-independent phosphoglycerate mutase (AlkP superfamily)